MLDIVTLFRYKQGTSRWTDSQASSFPETNMTSSNSRPRLRRKSARKPSGAAGAEPGNLRSTWRRDFLARLAESSNVTKSAEFAGVNPGTVYELRRRDPEFAQSWLEALCEGYDHLEMDLLLYLRTGELPGGDASKFNPAVALRTLSTHRETVGKERARRVNVEAAEIQAAIELKVALMRERVLERKAREEAQARGPDSE